jgi:hypothetical protein
MYGIEAVVPLGDLEALVEQENRERTWTVLADPDMQDPGSRVMSQVNRTLGQIMMRARYNSQRHYEVYLITADDEISDSDIREMFESDPQSSAETIRRIGVKLFDDRPTQKQVIS